MTTEPFEERVEELEVPAGVVVREVIEEPEEEEEKGEEDELAELFSVPEPEDNDMRVDDLLGVPDEDEDDLSDLTSVSPADVIDGEPIPQLKPKRKIVRRYRRTSKTYPPLPGIQGVKTR